MDTRSKIIALEQAIERAPTCGVVLASFDVLTVERIHRLKEIRHDSPCLMAVVSDVPGSLLNVTARAELAASLLVIDWVVIAENPKSLIECTAKVYDECEADSRRAADLVRYVHQRNSA